MRREQIDRIEFDSVEEIKALPTHTNVCIEDTGIAFHDELSGDYNKIATGLFSMDRTIPWEELEEKFHEYSFYSDNLNLYKEDSNMEPSKELIDTEVKAEEATDTTNTTDNTKSGEEAKGENNMKNETTTTTILNSNNPFAKTLAKEAEAKAAADKAKAEKDAAEAAQKALEDSEKKYADVADYDLVAAAKAMSEKKGMIEVKIAGITIGYASSEEDAEKMRVELHHYGKDLTSPEKVTMALAKQSAICAKAAELVEAGFVPERTIEVDGKKYLVNSKRAYTMEGHMVASLEDCGDVVLPVAIQDELYGKRIRETVAKEQPKVVNEPRPAAPKARKPRKIATDRVVSVTIQRQYGNLSLEEAVGQAILEQADKLRYDASHNSNWYNTKPITRPQASAFAQRICDRIVTESPIEGDSIDDLYNQISNLIFDVCAHDDAVGMASPSVGRDIANTVADVIINNSEIE